MCAIFEISVVLRKSLIGKISGHNYSIIMPTQQQKIQRDENLGLLTLCAVSLALAAVSATGCPPRVGLEPATTQDKPSALPVYDMQPEILFYQRNAS